MKKIILTLVVLLTITAQAEWVSSYETYSNCDKKGMSSFVLECIKNGNPKSDEEPEDWIGMCKNMSLSIFCTMTQYGVYSDNRFWSKKIRCNCDQCTGERAIFLCTEAGWLKKDK